MVDQAGASLEEMHQALETLNNAEGTLGKLIYEEDVYTELDSTLGSLNELLIDLKEHPKRYVSFSLIGRKDKKKD